MNSFLSGSVNTHWARAGKHKFGARNGKHKFRTRASKHKLGGVGGGGGGGETGKKKWEPGPGARAGAWARVREIQIPLFQNKRSSH